LTRNAILTSDWSIDVCLGSIAYLHGEKACQKFYDFYELHFSLRWGRVVYSRFPVTPQNAQGYVIQLRQTNYETAYDSPQPGYRHNTVESSVHIPGVAVFRPSGIYGYVGNGYYQNIGTGAFYNPTSGSAISGKNLQFKEGNLKKTSRNVFEDRERNITYRPGRSVTTPQGRYLPIGNGYYQNRDTGNIYNPTTGSYFSGK
jgi:hypothetical protein